MYRPRSSLLFAHLDSKQNTAVYALEFDCPSIDAVRPAKGPSCRIIPVGQSIFFYYGTLEIGSRTAMKARILVVLMNGKGKGWRYGCLSGALYALSLAEALPSLLRLFLLTPQYIQIIVQ